MLYCQLTWKMPTVGLFVLRAWKRPALWTARQGADGKVRGPCKSCSCLDWTLSKLDDRAPREITRIGLQDDMTFIGSAAALNRSWSTIEGALADAGHRLHSYKCGVWAPGFEQFEDAEVPMEVRNLCSKIPRKRHAWSEPPWVCGKHLAILQACRPWPAC